MRLAKNALLLALTMLALLIAVSAQGTRRSAEDPRNIAPTVGSGSPTNTGGPTGLFTVLDGQTLRRGEFTFSIAYSNFDRDPGDVDIVEVPVSFQIGLNDHIELVFSTQALRQMKVNSPANLSSFYLPNSQFRQANGAFTSGNAIVLAPNGGGVGFTGAIFRPQGTQPFCQFPYAGCSNGNFGFTALPGNPLQPGTIFGFASGLPVIGAPNGGSNGGFFGNGTAANFPGLGSVYGSILPGFALRVEPNNGPLSGVSGGATRPVVYSTAPSYLPMAPFINREFGESSLNSFTVGGKIRLNSVKSPYGLAITPFYRFYADKADDFQGFNQLQRGASPGGNNGDIGVIVSGDARFRKWLNVSGNISYTHNSSVKGTFPTGEFTILDRPDELSYGVGVDFPANKHFQPILEFIGTHYMAARTPNVFENDPMDGIGGVRIFPARWWGLSVAYRYNFSQQSSGRIEDSRFNQQVVTGTTILNAQNNVIGIGTGATVTSTGTIAGAFRPSTDPHGFILQAFAGHRQPRGNPDIVNKPANVTDLVVDKATVVVPCEPGTHSTSGGCADTQTIGVRTTAVDPENDVLTYSYTVSGGRINGTGANVSWDLSGARPGTYTVTAAVDDGCGFCGTPKTTTVTVASCPDCVPDTPPVPACSCPTLSVTGPSQVTQPGETMTFTANVSGGSQSSQTYNWTVSQGTIVSGQGQPVITVSTTGLSDTSITATVDIGGLCTDCPRTASETGPIAPLKRPTTVAEVSGNVPRDEIKNRVDEFYTALNADPTSHGVIINSGTDKEVAQREKDIRAAISFRKYDPTKVKFVRGSTEPGVRSQFFLVPAGVDDPVPGQ